MGSEKPDQLTQLVTCTFSSYGLDGNGVVYYQLIASGQPWYQLPAPEGQDVNLLAASKQFVWAFTDKFELWKMKDASQFIEWIRVPYTMPDDGQEIVSFAASGDIVIFGSTDGLISCLDLSTGVISSVTRFAYNAVVWRTPETSPGITENQVVERH
ncbi:hypothetical protein F5884DRAFT_253846 [Xylogone sp. PMI_703]|nr:hypothetical protein F5884DRAFT_253846 [Xylogone sp. PMI_703]